MGKADAAVRNWLSDKRRFADLFNGVMFSGREVVTADELEEQKGETSVLVPDKAGRTRPVQKYRDIVMRWDGKMDLTLLAVESQDKIHYAMPVRNMLYDGLEYAEQVRLRNKQRRYQSSEEFLSGFGRNDRLYPVITLVFYYDTKGWDGAKSLYDMMGLREDDEKQSLLRPYIPDYHINLVDAGNIRSTECFHTDLHEVMGMLKYRGDKEGLQKYIKENSSYFSNLDKDSYFAVGSFLKSKRLMKKIDAAGQGKERHLDMCKAIEDLYEDGIEKGIKKGIEKGIVQGKRDTALNLKKMGMAAEQIAQAVGETAAIVREWLSEANAAK